MFRLFIKGERVRESEGGMRWNETASFFMGVKVWLKGRGG